MLPAPLNLQQLADIIGAELVGDESSLIVSLASLQSARDYQLAFYTNKSYKKYLATTNAGCVLMHFADEDAFIATLPLNFSAEKVQTVAAETIFEGDSGQVLAGN